MTDEELRMACVKLAVEMHQQSSSINVFSTAEAFYLYVKTGKKPELRSVA